METESIFQKPVSIAIDMTNTTRENLKIALCDVFEDCSTDESSEKFALKDGDGRTWGIFNDSNIKAIKVQENGSITFMNSTYGVRLRSGNIEYEKREVIGTALKAINTAKAVLDRKYKCGIVFEFSAENYTPKKVQNLINIFLNKQNLIFKAFSIEEKYTQYFSRINKELSEAIDNQNYEAMDDLYLVLADIIAKNQHLNNRHILNCGLRINKMITRKKIEFVFSFDNMIWEKVESLITLCLAIDNEAMKRNRIKRIDSQIENEKFAMRTWLNRLGLKGQMFKRQRKHLMANLSGNAAWRSGQAPVSN